MKKQIFFIFGIIFLLAIIILPLVKSEDLVCCQETKSGAKCQEVFESECASGAYGTSCESTSSCRVGTCYSSATGDCLEQTSKYVCELNGMSWDSRPVEEVEACQVGCCTNFGVLTSEVECNEMSSRAGMLVNFDPSVVDDASCSSFVTSDREGACAYNLGSRRTCTRETERECLQRESNSDYSNIKFFEGFLCSDESAVRADCGVPSKIQTTCIEGSDAVYFLDTCGNLANVYDEDHASGYDEYWSKISAPSCNSDPSKCGNCDSSTSSQRGEGLLGTTCKKYERGFSVEPESGEYVCADMGCDTDGDGRVDRKHGESWCLETDSTSIFNFEELGKSGEDLFGTEDSPSYNVPGILYGKDSLIAKRNLFYNVPGTTYAKESCQNGEVIQEMCDPGRAEVCVKNSVNGWERGQCVTNLWDTCLDQDNREDCLDREKRHCNWFSGRVSFKDKDKRTGYCVPIYTPGFDFWKGDGNGENYCNIGSNVCEYEIFQSGLGSLAGTASIENGEECIGLENEAAFSYPDLYVKKGWINEMQERCMRIGDCGPKNNSFHLEGDKKPEDFWKIVANEGSGMLRGKSKTELLK